MPHASSATGLYWSLRGHVVCGDHAAHILDAAWNADGWAPLPESSQQVRGIHYQCEHCAPDHRAITRPSTSAADGAATVRRLRPEPA